MLTRKTMGTVATALVVLGLLLADPLHVQVPVNAQVVDTEGSDYTVAEALAENLADHDAPNDYLWDSNEAVVIALDDSGTTVTGIGAVVDGNTVYIAAAGTYRLSGALTDGQIIVKSKDEESVTLILNGVSIACSSSAPVYVKNAGKVILVLAEDTENYVTDGASRTADDSGDGEPNAAIFSKENLTICGEGSLTVDGNYQDGISGKDGLIIAGGTIVVTAVDDGIRGKDYLEITGGSVTVNAAGNGLKADNDADATAGYILIEDGAVNVTSTGDAIAAQTDVLIAGGTITLTSGGGSSKTVSANVSCKGIKATAALVIDGGTLTISSADDAIHSGDSISINGGTFVISSGDDGIHADAALGINGGQISIAKSYEGIESRSVILINGGSICIVASDDGVNIAGGMDGSGIGAIPGNMSASGNCYLYINGGYLVVQAVGDGIDVNGAIVMTGGEVLVNGPTENMNGALDYDSSFKITGGFLVAAGSSGMAQAPGTSSTQCSVLVTLKSACQAKTLFRIQARDGTDVLTFAPTKTYQTVAFSSSALTKGSSYDVYYGGSCTGTVQDGLYEGGAYTAGTKYSSFTISSVVTNVGSGSAAGGGGGIQR